MSLDTRHTPGTRQGTRLPTHVATTPLPRLSRPYQKGVSAFVAGSSLLFFFFFERTDTFSPSYFFLKVSVSSWRGSVHVATALLDGDLRSKFVLVPVRYILRIEVGVR